MDRREVIPSANEDEFEEINELDKSDEEEESDVVSEKDNNQPLQEFGILKNRPKKGSNMVPSSQPSAHQYFNEQMPSAQSDYRSAYADDTEIFKSAKAFNQAEEIKQSDSLIHMPQPLNEGS